MCLMDLASRHALVKGLVVAPTTRLRSQSLRLLVTVVRGSAAATQQAASAKVPVAAVSSGKALPRQVTASKQQQHAKVTLHKNRRSKHSMPVPSEPVVQQLPVSRFASCRALVLDSSYRPIDVINWQRALILDLFEKVDVLEYFEDVAVRSARQSHLIPAVCRVRFYVKRDWKGARLSLSRRNIMLRDRFCCQYCGTRTNLTLDHVKPVSKGGKFTWDNMVTACMSCNGKKGDNSLKQLGWSLRKKPKEPTASEVSIIAGMGVADMRTPPKEWHSYIFPGQMPCFTAHDAPL